jgi:hypothetical protein
MKRLEAEPLLVSSLNLVQPNEEREERARNQSDPPRRVYRTCHAVPVLGFRVGDRRLEAGTHDPAGRQTPGPRDAGLVSGPRATIPLDVRGSAAAEPSGREM